MPLSCCPYCQRVLPRRNPRRKVSPKRSLSQTVYQVCRLVAYITRSYTRGINARNIYVLTICTVTKRVWRGIAKRNESIRARNEIIARFCM